MAQQRGRTTQDRTRGTTNSGVTTTHEQEDAPTTSAACEQCRSRKVKCDRQVPQCSNCERAGVFCEFPNRGKRVNHVKQLVEDVSGLATRLNSIDGTINNLVRQMSTFSANLSTSSETPSRESTATVPDLSWSDTEDLETIFYNGQNGHNGGEAQDISRPAAPKSSQDSRSSLEYGSIHADLGGRIAARFLFDGSRRILESFLDKTTNASPDSLGEYGSSHRKVTLRALTQASPTLEAELRAKIGSYPLDDYKEEELVKDAGQPVATPPQSLLENSLQHFLDDFNAITPVFESLRLKSAIAAYYSSDNKDESYDLCFNNIIVLSLGARSCLSRMDSAPHSASGMYNELLPAFLNNSFRAFSHLDFFLQPKLVNVQALASLAMVIREHHESKVFDMVCHLAVNVMKSIGIQNGVGSEINAPEIDQDQRELYWALFVMDKQRSYIAGRPFDLHFYDSDARLFASHTPRDLSQQCRTAHIHMMSVWEEIYISLYSSKAFRMGAAYRQHQIGKLDRLSRKWCTRNGHLLSKASTGDSPAVENWRVELKYGFHVGQVLIHRASEESSRQVETNNSRAALRIIQEVWLSKHTEATVALLFQLLRHYPMVALHGLYHQFLTSPCQESLDDIALIESVAAALKAICDPRTSSACLPQIYEGVSWYLEVAQIIRNAMRLLETSKETQINGPKRSQGSLHISPRRHEARHAETPPAKKPRNLPLQSNDHRNKQDPPNSHFDKAQDVPWMMQGMEKTTTFETLPSQFQPFRTLTDGFNTTSLPPLDDASQIPPLPIPPFGTTNDDLYHFLHHNLPTPSSPIAAQPANLSTAAQTQALVPPPQASSTSPTAPLPTSTLLPAAMSTTAAAAEMKTKGGSNIFGGGSAAGTGPVGVDMCDSSAATALFDPFFGRDDFPDSWEAELGTEQQPMADDFFLPAD